MANKDQGFPATKDDAQQILSRFTPFMGRHYGANRNFDRGPGAHKSVSTLSPYVRHRVLSERTLIKTALGAHGYPSAEKFIQEVFWRSYWKGWLERRPAIWTRYQADVADLLHRLDTDPETNTAYQRAISGQTGIACFDAWVDELVTTGYVHNHARMWFASIWIFTLGLPWQLGADFFLMHLLDGDAASNTLSWRWVAGLQTKGKTYLARADNIQRYTEGRFHPVGQLADTAAPLDDDIPAAGAPPVSDTLPHGPVTIMVTDDHLDPLAFLPVDTDIVRVIILDSVNRRTPRGTSPVVRDFVRGLQLDLRGRLATKGIDAIEVPAQSGAEAVMDHRAPGSQVAALYAPQGAGRTVLDAVDVSGGKPIPRYLSDWDATCYPHCKKGFFVFKKAIPGLISDLIG